MTTRAFNWVRLDCAFARNDKVLSLIEGNEWRAISVYCFALGHCRDQKTAGFISRAALRMLHGRSKDAAVLVAEGLWHEEAGGWLVHDWGDYQETNEEQELRSSRARIAAEKRWGHRRAMPRALPLAERGP